MIKIFFSSLVLLLSFNFIKTQTAEGSCEALVVNSILSSVFTSFKSNGDLKLDVIPEYAQYLKDNGILDIIISGYVGEGSSMNVCDRIALIRAWVDAASPLGIGLLVEISGGLPFNDTLILAELCVELNVKAIVVLPDTIYTPTTAEEFIADLQLIAKVAVGIPIIYESIRVFEAVSVVSPVDIFILAKAQIPCLAGIITNINTALNIKAATSIDDKLIIISGHESISATIQLGLSANVNSFTNHFPGLALGIAAAVQAGDSALADRLQAEINERANIIIGQGDIEIIVKTRLFVVNPKVAFEWLTGIKSAIPRPPLQPATEEVVIQIANGLIQLGVTLIGSVASVMEAVV